MYYGTERDLIIAASEFLAALICCISIILESISRLRDKKESMLMRLITFSAMISLFTDGISYLIDENPLGNRILINKICLPFDFAGYLWAFAFVIIFVLTQFTSRNSKVRKVGFISTATVLVIDTAMLIINMFTGIVYTIDENNTFENADGFYVFSAFIILLGIIAVALLIYDRKNINSDLYKISVTCIIIMSLGGFLEMFMDDFPMTNFSVCVGILILYGMYKMLQIRKGHLGKNSKSTVFLTYLMIGMLFCLFGSFIMNMTQVVKVVKEDSDNMNYLMSNLVYESMDEYTEADVDAVNELIEQYEDSYHVDISLIDTDEGYDCINDFCYEDTDEGRMSIRYLDNLNKYLFIMDYSVNKIDVVAMVIPGLSVAILGIVLMLLTYFGMNHFNNKVDEELKENKETADYLKKVSETDGLTGQRNRYAYEIEKISIESEKRYDNLVVFIFDVNGLKTVNDNIGHNAGDELITAAGKYAEKVFSKYGVVYRTGGDEFCVIAYMDKMTVNELIAEYKDEISGWEGKYSKELSVSVGYACAIDNADTSFDKLAQIADEKMYKDKEVFYKTSGKDRRKR